MKKIHISLLVVAILTLFTLQAQVDQPNSFGKGSTLFQETRIAERGPGDFFNPDWAPFYHGVASGDPLANQVIIWTRVSPNDDTIEEVEVDWQMATDPELANIISSGTFTTNKERDFTVKVDVQDLSPGTTYYYGFMALGKHSLTGKTKTTPIASNIDHFKFGVVSCSNYQAGYFNAYGQLAKRNDLDAIIHLGDYIYEYGNRVYGAGALWEARALEPDHEIINLEDYRTRYSTYRLDTNLIRLHQQHPFITVWDDHEVANDSYVDGAGNHTEGAEGDWATRKLNSKRAYFEWMPIRDHATEKVYRKIQYGELVDLILLDTRLEGREQQLNDILDPALNDPNRTILGAEQKTWFLDQLANSTAKWKIVGQQVVLAEFHVGWASSLFGGVSYELLESTFLDIWDGYPAERSEIIAFLDQQKIDNVVILSGDFHTSLAFDIVDPPVNVTLKDTVTAGRQAFYETDSSYDPLTGQGSKAVEFVTPSVTSANFDENTSASFAYTLQMQINREVKVANNTVNLGNPNPHMKYADLRQHGYVILDVKADSVQANWYYTRILDPEEQEKFGVAYYTKDTQNHLQQANSASKPKTIQDIPAPQDPPGAITSTKDPLAKEGLLILSAYPNPAASYNRLHYVTNKPAHLTISLFNVNGQLISKVLDNQVLAGIYSLKVDTADLAAGVYYYHLEAMGQVWTRRFVKL